MLISLSVVNFDRGGMLSNLLVDFMFELNLAACDLSFRNAVRLMKGMTVWPILGLITLFFLSHTHLVSDVYLSSIHFHCSTFHALPSSSPVRPARVDWFKASPSDLENYCDLVYQNASSSC